MYRGDAGARREGEQRRAVREADDRARPAHQGAEVDERQQPQKPITAARHHDRARVGLGQRRRQLGDAPIIGPREIARPRENAVVVADVVAPAQDLDARGERLARHRTGRRDDADRIAGRETRRPDHFRRRRRRPPSPSGCAPGWALESPARTASDADDDSPPPTGIGTGDDDDGGSAATGRGAAACGGAATGAGSGAATGAGSGAVAARAAGGARGAGAGALCSAALTKRTRMPAAAASADSTTSVTRACCSRSSTLMTIGVPTGSGSPNTTKAPPSVRSRSCGDRPTITPPYRTSVALSTAASLSRG